MGLIDPRCYAHAYLFLLSLFTDLVLEKAMHKCVLKPLKSIIEATLHDFQVRGKQDLL